MLGDRKLTQKKDIRGWERRTEIVCLYLRLGLTVVSERTGLLVGWVRF